MDQLLLLIFLVNQVDQVHDFAVLVVVETGVCGLEKILQHWLSDGCGLLLEGF